MYNRVRIGNTADASLCLNIYMKSKCEIEVNLLYYIVLNWGEEEVEIRLNNYSHLMI